MQPLISPIDHESRSTSHRAEEQSRTSEATPLLQRFPRQPGSDVHRRRTYVVVSLLLLILLSGIGIGIYLLVVQSKSEHVLPPIEIQTSYVSLLQWHKDQKTTQPLSLVPLRKADKVIVVQTDTEQCDNTQTCVPLLNTMQERGNLQYNFLVSSDGQIYEAIGWDRKSPMFPEYSMSDLVLAFIGNYTYEAPTPVQVLEAKMFLNEAVSLQYLAVNFHVIGRKTKQYPTELFMQLSKLPQWNNELSDAE